MRNCHFAAGGVGNLACFSHSLAQEDLGMLEANSLNYRWQIKHMNMQGKWCLDFWKSCCLAWQSKKDHIFPNFFHKQVPCSRNFIPSRHAFYGRIAVAAGDVAGPAGRHGSPWLSRCWIFEADQSNTWNLGTVSLQKSKTYFTYLYIMIIQDYTGVCVCLCTFCFTFAPVNSPILVFILWPFVFSCWAAVGSPPAFAALATPHPRSIHRSIHLWRFHSHGGTPNGWFRMENPNKKWMI